MGTIRSNLDPFGDYTDQELWNALEQVSEWLFVKFNIPSQVESNPKLND